MISDWLMFPDVRAERTIPAATRTQLEPFEDFILFSYLVLQKKIDKTIYFLSC